MKKKLPTRRISYKHSPSSFPAPLELAIAPLPPTNQSKGKSQVQKNLNFAYTGVSDNTEKQNRLT
jgi:hypothetical protein